MSIHTESTTHAQDHHDRDYVVIINGEQYIVTTERLSYERLVTLAYPNPPAPDVRYTVTYRKAKDPHEGSLAPGQSVEIKKTGTIFNVTPTTKS